MLSKYFYMTYTFIISDESVNADGFVIQTKGIRTERFKKDPVMLYMHAREKGVIGRWDNIRTEGSQLIADAVFDENNPLGKEVKERVDGGFLRSASIGLSVLNYERIDGVDTVTDCELTEVSIVDIPSNRNAVKLFDKRGLIVLSLKESADGDKDLRTQLIEVLKLPATATDGVIIETVTALSGNAGPAEPDTEKALRLGYVESSQLMLLKHMARTDKSAFRKFMQDKEQAAAVDIDKELKQAVNLGKFGMPICRSVTVCIRAYRQTVGCQGSEGGPRSHARKGVVCGFLRPEPQRHDQPGQLGTERIPQIRSAGIER